MKKWLLIGITLVFLLATVISLMNQEISSQIKSYGQQEVSREEAALQAVSAEEIRTGFLSAVNAYEPGTAGSSLKRAVAAANVLEFAAENHSALEDKAGFSEALQMAWNEMTEAEKSRFPEQFASVAELADETLQDFSSLSGLFEDAGVLEKTQQLLQKENLRDDWEALKSCVQTIKGS